MLIGVQRCSLQRHTTTAHEKREGRTFGVSTSGGGGLKLMAHTLETYVQSEKLSRCVCADTGAEDMVKEGNAWSVWRPGPEHSGA